MCCLSSFKQIYHYFLLIQIIYGHLLMAQKYASLLFALLWNISKHHATYQDYTHNYFVGNYWSHPQTAIQSLNFDACNHSLSFCQDFVFYAKKPWHLRVFIINLGFFQWDNYCILSYLFCAYSLFHRGKFVLWKLDIIELILFCFVFSTIQKYGAAHLNLSETAHTTNCN